MELLELMYGGLLIVGVAIVCIGLKLLSKEGLRMSSTPYKLKHLLYIVPGLGIPWYLYWVWYDVGFWGKSLVDVAPVSYIGLALCTIAFGLGIVVAHRFKYTPNHVKIKPKLIREDKWWSDFNRLYYDNLDKTSDEMQRLLSKWLMEKLSTTPTRHHITLPEAKPEAAAQITDLAEPKTKKTFSAIMTKLAQENKQ
jgi:hypothetical protein